VTEQDDDFATLFEASLQAKRFDEGQTIAGTVIAIGAEVAFIDVGGKGEATIDIEELIDDEGALEVEVGDRIEAMVVSTSGGLKLSRKLARGAASMRQLADAFHAGLPVEGKVERAVKGGYEVRIAGQRAFCPISQIDIIRTTDPTVHIGKTYAFNIIEYKEGGKNVVVSRRKQLEHEQRATAAAMRKSIVPGAVITGRVVSVPDFGAFVDLGGGIQGLLHVSEMSWTRVGSPSEVVAVGDEITVRVLRVDEATEKISLGLKQLQDDPWTTAAAKFPVGQVRTGRVTRLADFGAFLELEPGFTGLLPFAESGIDRGTDMRKALPIGSEVEVAILEVDPEARRIRLSRKAVAEQREKAELRDYATRQDAEPSASMGSIADKLRDALGRK